MILPTLPTEIKKPLIWNIDEMEKIAERQRNRCIWRILDAVSDLLGNDTWSGQLMQKVSKKVRGRLSTPQERRIFAPHWLAYYIFSENETRAWERILEWILWINSTIPSSMVRNYTQTPIFPTLETILARFRDRTPVEDWKICIDFFSIRILLLAIDELINDLTTDNSEINPYGGYIQIIKAYKEFLDTSPTYA